VIYGDERKGKELLPPLFKKNGAQHTIGSNALGDLQPFPVGKGKEV